ncbi:DUF4265 domain-containing protein [Saccharothrix longispora]|uniref:DUF4265 domain-containing protein n=1 Tax=Saccharothrix longispora TaxID=33920 RepID=UPI0028FDBCDC|nr:DUF4265 domain-containing protein [Saccharothrix longispora]MDU0290437.1 DUF4265 domain-containing protein [Saccharothrix longispora]
MAEHRLRPPGMFRVAFDLPQVSATWPPFNTERIWARKTSAPYQLEVRNIPFFVKDLACGDIIRAKPDHDRRELVFDSLVKHSGHSTIRIIVRGGTSSRCGEILGLFRSYECPFEFTNVDFHFAVDIPGNVDYPSLRGVLVEMVEQELVEVEEAFIAPGHESQIGG